MSVGSFRAVPLTGAGEAEALRPQPGFVVLAVGQTAGGTRTDHCLP